MHMNNRPRWDRIMIKHGPKNLVTLSLQMLYQQIGKNGCWTNGGRTEEMREAGQNIYRGDRVYAGQVVSRTEACQTGYAGQDGCKYRHRI